MKIEFSLSTKEDVPGAVAALQAIEAILPSGEENWSNYQQTLVARGIHNGAQQIQLAASPVVANSRTETVTHIIDDVSQTHTITVTGAGVDISAPSILCSGGPVVVDQVPEQDARAAEAELLAEALAKPTRKRASKTEMAERRALAETKAPETAPTALSDALDAKFEEVTTETVASEETAEESSILLSTLDELVETAAEVVETVVEPVVETIEELVQAVEAEVLPTYATMDSSELRNLIGTRMNSNTPGLDFAWLKNKLVSFGPDFNSLSKLTNDMLRTLLAEADEIITLVS